MLCYFLVLNGINSILLAMHMLCALKNNQVEQLNFSIEFQKIVRIGEHI